MKAEKYRELTKVHLLHRIWHNELDLALQELTFWQDLLNTLSEVEHPDAADAQTWQHELDQLHGFQRLIKRLLDDIHTTDQETAMGVRFDHVLDKETRLDHQYLRTEMDSFHADFRAFKTTMRQYIVTQTTF